MVQPKIKTTDFKIEGWEFFFQSSAILKSTVLDEWTEELDLNNTPECIFGNNICQLKKGDFVFEINPKHSVKLNNFEIQKQLLVEPNEISLKNLANHINVLPQQVKVKFHENWKDRKVQDPNTNEEIKEKIQKSDCFYSTPYKGTIKLANHEDLNPYFQCQSFKNELTDQSIPLHRLNQDNPILFSESFNLYEDELSDCGQVTCSWRFRAMKDCWFGLLRMYLKVDDVQIRIYDTRIFHSYDSDYILREFTIKEDDWQGIAQAGFKFTTSWSNSEELRNGIMFLAQECQINDKQCTENLQDKGHQ